MWITGVGAVSCLGPGASLLWEKAAQGESGLREGLGRVPGAGSAMGFSVQAIDEAMRQAGWSGLGPRDGLIVATTTGQIRLWDNSFYQFAQGQMPKEKFAVDFLHQPLHDLTKEIQKKWNHQGPSLVVSSACSAGAQAVAMAAMWIEQGFVDRCLVGGVEVLCDLTLEGFRCLQLLSTENCRPFDQNRKGINLSEGAGFMCMEKSPRKPLAKVSGFGLSSDAHHMTGPHPEGRGSFEAMRKAVARAGISASEISWVHAHGTGSAQNDFSEGVALKRLFHPSTPPPVSSTKAVHGHALGASGAIESVLVVESLMRQQILPSVGLQEPDSQIPLVFAREAKTMPVRHVLKNTLGFGGNNASLVFSHPEAGGAR